MPTPDADSTAALATEIRQCCLCKAELPLGPKPIVQLHSKARILIASQAPGSIAHRRGTPFYDPSGRRLREWMGVTEDQFYDPTIVAIVPMGFCYPGSHSGKGKSGDLPPLPRCAETWRKPVLSALPNIKLTLLIGQHAIRWHLPESPYKTLTEVVKNGGELSDSVIPLPHPSPRNNIWLHKNSWFERDVLPSLKRRVAAVL